MLGLCSKLVALPEQLGKMESLQHIQVCDTAIEELPESIGQLSKLQVLNLKGDNKLKYVPSSIWNLTSLAKLHLIQEDIFSIDFPDTVKNMKLEKLHLRCNRRLWLPIIQSFSSLRELHIDEDGQSDSSTKPLSLSKLYNLQSLELVDCKSIGSGIPELPLDLRSFRLSNHTTLKQLPDLSSLEQLKFLDIHRCISLESLPPLPPHLESLKVEECTSLQDVPDLSMLKELKTLSFAQCSNLKLINLKESYLKVMQDSFSFRADIPNREVAEWFSYKSSENTLSFEIPPSLGDNFLGLALWVVYTCKTTEEYRPTIRAVIRNKTDGITKNFDMYGHGRSEIAGEVQSRIESIKRAHLGETWR